MGYAVAPCFTFVAAMIMNNIGGLTRQFYWSVFGICLAEMLENSYCRIPNNESCDNDYFTAVIIFCTIFYGIHKLLKTLNSKSKGLIISFGIGIAIAKTLLSKLWWAKILAGLAKLFALWF